MKSLTQITSEKELNDIAQLYQRFQYALIAQNIPLDEIIQRLEIEFSYDFQFWKLEQEDLPIGFASGYRESVEKYQSYGIFVVENQRQKGYAHMLKQAQMQYAKDIGCKILKSATTLDNTAAKIVLSKQPGIKYIRGNSYIIETSI